MRRELLILAAIVAYFAGAIAMAYLTTGRSPVNWTQPARGGGR